MVALEDAAEAALAEHLVGTWFLPQRWLRGLSDGHVADPLMRAMFVVMRDELGDQERQVSLTENDELVQALLTRRPDPALGVGVHVRAGGRREHHLDTGALHGLQNQIARLPPHPAPPGLLPGRLFLLALAA